VLHLKSLRVSVSAFDATFTGGCVSVASKGVAATDFTSQQQGVERYSGNAGVFCEKSQLMITQESTIVKVNLWNRFL
jgi:hypothetical protein